MENEIKQMDTLKKELQQVNDKLNSIITLLNGHELDSDSGGLVHKVNIAESRIAKVEQFKDRITYVAVGMAIPASWGIIDIVSKVILAVK